MPHADGTLAVRSALNDQQVAFTGRLASMSRREAEALVKECGGQCGASITRTTTLLIVGMDGWPLLADGRLSGKLQRAEVVRRQGGKQRLRILSEEQFLELVGRKAPQDMHSKPMDAAHVCELVGVTPETLERWEMLGLVRSTDNRYDFRDLVSLQTVAALVAQGASSRTIAQSVRTLSRVLPGTDRPLAQLKLLAHEDSLVAEVNGSLMSPGGQLLMRFEPDEAEETPIGSLAIFDETVADNQYTAEQWHEIGSVREDAGEWEQAEVAYRNALAIQPLAAAVHFNLANVLLATNRRQAAEERYRVALEQDPGMAEAWFNLGDLLDEAGRGSEAIECLRHAVACNPQFADAHYNLAVCLEQAHLTEEATSHWREYVRLDPASEWATFARRKLSG